MQQVIELMCPEHNEKIICAKMTEAGSKMQCQKCLIGQNISITEFSQILNELRQDKIKRLVENKNSSEKRLSSLKKLFLAMKEEFNQQINQIIQMIESEKNEMETKFSKDLSELTMLIQEMTISQVEQNIQGLKNESSINESLQLELDKKIRIKGISQYIFLIKSLNKLIQQQSAWKKSQKKVQLSQILNKKLNEDDMDIPIQDESGYYERIFEQSNISSCYAMVMDKEEKTLVNSQSKMIQVWKFNNNNGQLTLKQTLEEHEDDVRCLCFSKISRWFISGGDDTKLRIWKEEQNEKWMQFQVLSGHNHWILDIVLNNCEDQLISSSGDYTIRVWMRSMDCRKWECKQQLAKDTNQVLYLSLNSECNILASCGYDRLRIWEKDNNMLWRQKQVLDDPQNDKYQKICFVDSNELIVTCIKGQLYSLIKNSQGLFTIQSSQLLNKTKEQDTYGFPIAYNNNLRMAICRQSKYFTNILMKQANGQFAVHQVLKGDYQARYLSHNGQFLFLGAFHNHNIEVWKLK